MLQAKTEGLACKIRIEAAWVKISFISLTQAKFDRYGAPSVSFVTEALVEESSDRFSKAIGNLSTAKDTNALKDCIGN